MSIKVKNAILLIRLLFETRFSDELETVDRLWCRRCAAL